MQRKLILVLLGIICVSTLSSYLSGYVQIESDRLLLHKISGFVGAGNYSYWQLGYSGPLVLELTSISGDADLYVADIIRPGYEHDKNNFSSATCGSDLVMVPDEFPRPVGLAVFGHWSHTVSEYSVQVYLDLAALITDDHMLTIETPHQTIAERHVEVSRRREKTIYKKSAEGSKPPFMRLLRALDMIFEMFIL